LRCYVSVFRCEREDQHNGNSVRSGTHCAQAYRGKKSEIRRSLDYVAEGNPLASEQNSARLVARLMARNSMSREEAEAAAMGVRAFAEATPKQRERILLEAKPAGGPEAIWGQTIDFVGVAFFDRGRRAANAVARVAYRTGRGWGSGFKVAQRLFLTNNHVIPNPGMARDLAAEFDFELDVRDNPLGKTSFAFDPDALFITDSVEGLDFTLIALGDRLSGTRTLSDYGYSPLSDASDKHAIGEVVNIVQHPKGRYKEVVLRENRLVARGPEALHYVADTEPGSSGSPVYNNQWQPVALHHWGGPYRGSVDEKGQRVPREVNEGIRISAVVAKIKAQRAKLRASQRALLDDALRRWEETVPPGEAIVEAPASQRAVKAGPRENKDGSITWTYPLEITVRAPLDGRAGDGVDRIEPSDPAPQMLGLTTAEAMRPSDDFSDRVGYESGFLTGHVVPLPALSEAQKRIAARNREARRGDNPFELKYHHFSSVVNADRKLPFYVACNIDGRTAKYINRSTGAIEPLDPTNTDHGLMESMLAEGAEATEQWYGDDRLQPGSIAEQDVYESQDLRGFPTSTGMARTLRMFQRGHLVRRLDPAWGSRQQAQLAEADTFHFTNCVPQVGFFNMGRASPSLRGTGGGKLWRAVENLVLRNARNMRTRVTCFTGPIFRNDDRRFRTIKVPKRFFKVAVWAEDDGLRSLGMIADQSKVFGVWPEALFGGEASDLSADEAFQDADEIERVDDFLTTIEAIETATKLDFGRSVRDADVRAGQGESRPRALDEVPIGGRSRRRTASARARTRGAAKKTRRKVKRAKTRR
jgi:endonuclease G